MMRKVEILLDDDWSFFKGDPVIGIKGKIPGMLNDDLYNRLSGLEWTSVRIPHDWDRYGPFKEEFPSGDAGGYAPCGIGWYRIKIPIAEYLKRAGVDANDAEALRNLRLSLVFDGIYRNSTVWINRKKVNEHHYGYGTFEFTIPVELWSQNISDDAEMIIRVDNSKQPSCRWYSGSGIFRNVWLVIQPPIYIPRGGLLIGPQLSDEMFDSGEEVIELDDVNVEVRTEIAVDNFDRGKKGLLSGRSDGVLEAVISIRDKSGNELVSDSRKIEISEITDYFSENGRPYTLITSYRLSGVRLWSSESPVLYECEVKLKYSWEYGDDGRKGPIFEDIARETFGFRHVKFTPHGLFINGKNVTLKGVCLHHDGGAVGAAVPIAVWERRLVTLKEMGANAIRTSHNIPSEEFMDLCDRMGFYVIAEAFDKWVFPKPKYAWGGLLFLKEWKSELESFIRRDRNHPSIIQWSLGNEVGGIYGRTQSKLYIKMYQFTKSLDPTRAVSVAFSPKDTLKYIRKVKKKGSHTLSPGLDVINTNYGERYLKTLHALHPDKAIIITEAHHWYRNKLKEETDLPTSEKYANCTDRNPWYDVVENDYCVGQFLWVGIEYLGEVRDPYPYHGRTNAPIGICGFKKPQSGFHESVWKNFPEHPFVHLAVLDENLRWPPGKKEFDFPKIICHWNFGEFYPESSKYCIDPGKKVGMDGESLEVWTFTNCPAVELKLNGKSLGIKKKSDYPYNKMVWKIAYQPGILEASGLDQSGNVVCSTSLKTSEQPEKLRIYADKERIVADGKDCIHITMEAVDANGVLYPFAGVKCKVIVDGEARLIAVDNGDLSDFTEENAYLGPDVDLFWGKALAIIQSTKTEGSVRVIVEYSGDISGKAELTLESIRQ